MRPWQSNGVERAPQSSHARRPPGSGPLAPRREPGSRGPRWTLQSAFLLGAASLAGACLPHEEQRLSCDDVYPPGQFDYRHMEALIVQDQTRTTKGCLGPPCHSAPTQRGGVRLDTRDLIYEELSTRPELYYETLTTGYMPHDGIPWDEEDLKIFRSWYCAGAFPP
jgi:hypothetical protein